MAINHKKITQKWHRKWKEEKLFEPERGGKKKGFYIQVAYPYPSGAMHIGHARTYTVTDIVAKYHMLLGYNVLMPMGWHVSGTPVISTVELLQKKDPETLRKMTEAFRIPEGDLKKMETPEGFVDYFVNKAEYGYKKGFDKLGYGIDWRRELTTVDKQYNKFIEWQYRKLYDKGYIGKGKYPIRYCPHDKNAVGDHDLVEGEGVGIQEFTLLKFKYKDMFIVAATLRPETVFGQTNLWVDADVEYAIAEVESTGKIEKWIMSKEAAEKLRHQRKEVKVVGKIAGKTLIGEYAAAPGINRKVMILPSYFCDASMGSGIVTSVPGDSPDDWVALRDLQQSREECEKHGLDFAEVAKIKAVPIIKTKRYGDLAALKVCEEMGIKNQRERDKLEKAKKIVYKEGFHLGVMNKNCGKYAGMKVEKAKDLVKQGMIKNNEADIFYELEGKVVCRCGTPIVVNVLDDQWFVKYGNEKWKNESKKTLKKMKILPEVFRTQYENVFDWLEDKPCTRAKGLGTKFPWDTKQIIEPLGDSTIYMAYFTISHIIKEIDAKKLTDDAFDFVFLGKGSAKTIAKKTGIAEGVLGEMRKEFDYWYPLYYNTSATELIPNHMSFSIFHHTAIFPPAKRQLGTLNLGMLVIEGGKMASSKGNVVLVNDMCDEMGTDMLRFSLMNLMEPWMEANWQKRDIESGLKAMNYFLEKLFSSAKNAGNAPPVAKVKLNNAEKWILNRFRMRKNNFLSAMETFQLRSALQEISFMFINDLKWFDRRCNGTSGKSTASNALYKHMIQEWTKLMAPVMPHICEELWREALGNKNSVFTEKLPKKEKVDVGIEAEERVVKVVVEDVLKIRELAKIKQPKRVVLYTAPEWKWKVLGEIVKVLKGKPDFGIAMKAASKQSSAKKHGKELPTFVKAAVKRIPEYENLRKIDEVKVLNSAKEFLGKEFSCSFEIVKAEAADGKTDPAGKAKNAMPLKPAIYME